MPYIPKVDPLYLQSALHTALTIANATLENNIDTLFDRKADERLCADEIAFLRTTRLDEIAFETSGDATFRITNRNSRCGLNFSDRNATRGELRSSVLRGKLSLISNLAPTQSLYDGINSLLQSDDSDIFHYFLSSLPNFKGVLRRKDVGRQFVHALLTDIKAGHINQDTPIEQLEAIFSSIIKKRVEDEFKPLLDELDEKIEHLNIEAAKYPEYSKQKRSYNAAVAAATHLRRELDYAITNLIPDKSAFNRCVNAAIKTTEGTLAKHRGWKQFFARLACAVVSVGTLGLANLINYSINHTPGFFKVKTDSKKLVDEVNDLKENITQKFL